MLLTAGSAMAQTITIGETTYGKMSDAIAAAQDGDVIEIAGEIIVDSRIGFGAKQVYNVKGVGADAKFTRKDSYKAAMFLINGAATVNFENLTIDGNNVSELTANKPIEINNSATAASFTDCKFVNHIADRLIFTQKPLTLTNVSTENCEFTSGFVFVSNYNNGVTVAGASDYSVYIEGATSLTAGENLSGKISLALSAYDGGRTIVNGTTAVDVFSLANAPQGYELSSDGANIVLTYVNPVVYNETQQKYYNAFSEAVAAAQKNDVLVLIENVTLTDRFLNGVNGLTIKGQTPDIKIIRNFKNKLFLGNDKANTTFENLVLDCNNQDNNTYEIEVGANDYKFTLSNVKIINSKTTKGIFNVKDSNRTLSLVNVTVEDCETEVPDIDLNGKLTLEGNNNLSVNVKFNPGDISVAGELTNESPIMITVPEDTELGKTIVSGTTDATKFSLTNSGLKLEAGENNDLVLAKKTSTGIEDVTISDENAPVEYYNLQGVRISEPAAGQVVIRRQGKSVSKIYVK